MGILNQIASVAKNVGANVAAIGGAGRDKQYTPERAEALKNVRSMVKDRKDYFEEKRKFEREQFLKRPEQKTVSKIQKFMEKPFGESGMTRKGQRYTTSGIKYSATKSKGVSVKSPGRPRLSYKPRVDPLTGRIVRIPATVLYKRQRLAKRLNSAAYQKQQMQKAQMYQQRGINPQQAAQIEMIRQQRLAQQLAMQAQQPQQMQRQQIPMRQQIYRRPLMTTRQFPVQQQGTIAPDFFRGGTSVRPRERWLG